MGMIFSKQEFVKNPLKNNMMHFIIDTIKEFDDKVSDIPNSSMAYEDEITSKRKLINYYDERVNHIKEEQFKIKSEQESNQKIIIQITNDMQKKYGDFTKSKPYLSRTDQKLIEEFESLNQRYIKEKEENLNQIKNLNEEIKNFSEMKQKVYIDIEELKKQKNCKNISKQVEKLYQILPPRIVNSAITSLESFHISNQLSQNTPILQLVIGKMSYGISRDETKQKLSQYPTVLQESNISVPYLLLRNYSFAELFIYPDSAKGIIWNHFQTLCFDWCVLHRFFESKLYCIHNSDYILNEKLEYATNVNIISSCPEDSHEVLITVFFELKQRVKKVREAGNSSIWDYNIKHPNEKLPYYCVSFYDFSKDCSEIDMQLIFDNYNTAERVGIHFLFFVNKSYNLTGEKMEQLKPFLQGLRTLVYDSNIDCYKEVKDERKYYTIYNAFSHIGMQ